MLLHLISQIDPNVPVLFLETGKHFPETLAYRDELTDHRRRRRWVERNIEVDSCADRLAERIDPRVHGIDDTTSHAPRESRSSRTGWVQSQR